MAMAEAGDCEPAEEIQVTIAVGVVEIGTAPLHEGQWQAAVDVKLVFVRQFDDFSVGHDLSRVEADIWLKKALVRRKRFAGVASIARRTCLSCRMLPGPCTTHHFGADTR